MIAHGLPIYVALEPVDTRLGTGAIVIVAAHAG